jgi:3-isopropylmalate dehydrogenase
MKKKIAILAGDGIGPEVMQQTLRVLGCIADKFGHQFEIIEAKIGGQAYEHYQTHCPAETLQICQSADAILFGSVGGSVAQQHLEKWQNCEANSILKLRQHFNLSINIRPICVYSELNNYCPLRQEKIQKGIDFIIFRELTGGIYFGEHKQFTKDKKRYASDECIYNEEQIKSIAHAAFKAATIRNKKVCSVDKANVLATSKLWREIVNEVSSHYPEIELTHMLVDNCAMQMISNPQQFDVIVTENMFGDIISDLAAVLPGSLGLIPSASINHNGLGLYEPSGGSAPEIACKNIANPCAQLLSAAMMLRHSFDMDTEARLIEKAIKLNISRDIVTADIAQDNTRACSTSQFTDALITCI